MNRGLDAGLEKIHAIFDFGVRERNFVTQAVVQSKARIDFERILRVDVEVISAQAAPKISATLQEENRLSDFKTRKRVCNRRIHENQNAIARDSLQHVDLIVTVAASEFHFVASANPGERTVQIESVFVSVARTRDRISNGSKACDLNKWRAEGRVERRFVGKTERSGIGVVCVFVGKKICAEERKSRQPHDGR